MDNTHGNFRLHRILPVNAINFCLSKIFRAVGSKVTGKLTESFKNTLINAFHAFITNLSIVFVVIMFLPR